MLSLFPLLFLPPLAAFTVSVLEFYFRSLIWETDRFSAASGVDQVQHNQDLFCFRRSVFCSPLKSKVDNILVNTIALRGNPT
jgi:hypothetical protein